MSSPRLGEPTLAEWAALEAALTRFIEKRRHLGLSVDQLLYDTRGVVHRLLDHRLNAVTVHGRDRCEGAGLDEILDVMGVAAVTGLSVETVRRRARAGRWPGAVQLAGGAWAIPRRALITIAIERHHQP